MVKTVHMDLNSNKNIKMGVLVLTYLIYLVLFHIKNMLG